MFNFFQTYFNKQQNGIVTNFTCSLLEHVSEGGQSDVPPGGQRQEVPGRGDQTEHPRHWGVRGLGGSGTTGQFFIVYNNTGEKVI